MNDILTAYLRSDESIITRVFQIDNFNDYPPLFQFATNYSTESLSDVMLFANGISTNKNEARTKAIMETIERWYLCSSTSKKTKLLFELNTSTKKSTIVQTSPIQLYGSDSQGAAAAFSKEEAIYKGICELIERDAFAIYYYNKLTPFQIGGPFNKKINNLLIILNNYYFKVTLLQLITDISIPICLCILEDISGKTKPFFTLGLKCSLSWNEAIEGAIMESIQSLNSFRTIAQHESTKEISTHPIIIRLRYWFDKQPEDTLPFFFSGEIKKVVHKPVSIHKLDSLLQLLSMVRIPSIQWRLIYQFGYIYVVKVFIPELVSLPLSSRPTHLDNKRIYTVPVSLRMLKKPRTEYELNKIPHPFP